MAVRLAGLNGHHGGMGEAVPCSKQNYSALLHGFPRGEQQEESQSDKEGKKHRLAFSFFIHLEKPIAMPQIRGQRRKQSNIQEPHRCDNNLSDSLLFHDTPRVALNLTASRSLMTA